MVIYLIVGQPYFSDQLKKVIKRYKKKCWIQHGYHSTVCMSGCKRNQTLLCLCARLFICALWSPAGKGLTSWLSFVVSYCEFVTFPLVSWVRYGT